VWRIPASVSIPEDAGCIPLPINQASLQDKTHNFPSVLPQHLAEQADETLKSRYSQELLGV